MLFLSTMFAHISLSRHCIVYSARGANTTRGNGNNLANGSFIEMNLFKATSCYMH